MKSLISRESYRPEERYSGVYHIQGGMVTDADLDERSRITQDRTDHLGDDTIKDGVPVEGGAVAIAADGSVALQEGIIYADGVRGLLTAAEGANLTSPMALFSAQRDFPQGPALPGGTDQVIYADIWERPVHPLEDPYLADAGLHGAVTAFRTRTMTQLKAAPLTARDDIEAGVGDFPQIGTAKLAITPLNAEILADECDPCADVVSAEQGVSNALWRLEVIDVDGTPETPGQITLAWSIENAAAIAPSDTDEEGFERTNKVYEFYSEITESHLGVFDTASDAKRSAFVDDLSTTPSPATDHNGQPWPFVRRWDGQAVIDVTGASVVSEMGGGFTLSIAGQIITLRIDAFDAVLDLNGLAVVAGDYWLVELRRFAPETERIRLVKETPVGVIHHYCVLFGIDPSGNILPVTDTENRKLSFPVLSDMPATHVSFDNSCEKLYADAENVQDALDNLCDISADDIAFDPTCPELYDNAQNVQEALDALCNIDFSVHASFRLLFDWGVVCGIVPSLVKKFGSVVKITAGAYLDRAGRLTKFDGGVFDLNDLDFNAGIAFTDAQQLQDAFAKKQVCLALAAEEGGKTSVHVVPKSKAFGPNDPGFSEQVEACVKRKKGIDLNTKITNLSARERAVANKILLTSSGDGAFAGSARLTQAEARDAASFNDKLFKEYEKLATLEEVEVLKARNQQAKQDNPLGNTLGTAREVRQMQQATAVFAAFARSDDERLRRCVCEALFPTCPPELGKRPFYVPIACLRGGFDAPSFFLDEVCPFTCRKQAMTWRSLQYFIGEQRGKVAERFAKICCEEEPEKPGGPRPGGLTYDPGRYTALTTTKFIDEYQVADTFIGLPPKSVTADKTKVAVNDLSVLEAKKTLRGNGIEIVETIDINDEKALEIIAAKSVGVSSTDRLISAGEVRPGDKVGLLVQDGVARGYVLLERGSGKLPFPTAKKSDLTIAISKEDEVRATELVAATNMAKGELTDLISLRETLSADVTKLKTDVNSLTTEREKTTAALKDAETQLTRLAESRTTIVKEIEAASKELVVAEENRRKMTIALREGQPVTAILGNRDPQLISKLAGEGITTVADLSKLTPAKINRLNSTGVLTTADARKFKKNAGTFIKKPLG